MVDELTTLLGTLHPYSSHEQLERAYRLATEVATSDVAHHLDLGVLLKDAQDALTDVLFESCNGLDTVPYGQRFLAALHDVVRALKDGAA